jgi:hypothetical protein
MRIRLSIFLLIAACVLAASPVLAQSTPPAKPATTQSTQSGAAELPEWDRLTPQQREALIAPVRERWDGNPAQRAHMLDRAHRWSQMTPEERQRAHHGMKRWKRMDPEQKQQMRAFYERTRNMTPEQRKAEREKLKAMTPARRREWLEQTAPPAP